MKSLNKTLREIRKIRFDTNMHIVEMLESPELLQAERILLDSVVRANVQPAVRKPRLKRGKT